MSPTAIEQRAIRLATAAEGQRLVVNFLGASLKARALRRIVDSLYRVVFEEFRERIEAAPKAEDSGPVESHHDLYLVEDRQLWRDWDTATAKLLASEGFAYMAGKCPALVAEQEASKTESALASYVFQELGVPDTYVMSRRRQAVALLCRLHERNLASQAVAAAWLLCQGLPGSVMVRLRSTLNAVAEEGVSPL